MTGVWPRHHQRGAACCTFHFGKHAVAVSEELWWFGVLLP
jgi:hypothetical protein